MSEEKNTALEGQSPKKSASRQKPLVKKPKKEQTIPDTQTKSLPDAESFVKKIHEIADKIEEKPIKSFEKKEQAEIIKSYEKLICKMVREINNSRR
ncbi:MAG: hypothetical protein NG784_08710 [Candidatus Jettenia sp.]|nr:hypothetical protein [Candidatus Jettenia sp.]